MKPLRSVGVVAIVACVGLAACGKKEAAAPTGQVVATVDGKEITSREVQAELTGSTFADDKARKQAEQAAVQAIINRKVMANAARERGLDKTPDYAIQRQKAEDMALVQELQNSIIKTVPPASREEAERYVSDNPDIFAERKIFTLDQVRVSQQLDPKIAAQLQPLKSIDEVVGVLNANKIEYQRLPNKLDAVGSDPKMIEQILKLKPGDMFAVPSQGVLLINEVKSTQVTPFTGEPAVNYAMKLLTRQHSQEAVMREFGAMKQKAEGKVQYAEGYEPPKPPVAVNAPAPAVNATAAK